MSQLVDLLEAEQPRITAHLNPRKIVDSFLSYVGRVYPIADTFGRNQAGDLQFDAWYRQWIDRLSAIDRALWKQLRDAHQRQEHGKPTELIEIEISVASDPSITGQHPAPGTHAEVRKHLVRFADSQNRPASEVCADYLRLAKRFVHDFVRDYTRFLP